jgi:peptidoglycan/xylan/chitin deacetylase (PgdA/CDA1 family)
MRANPDMLKILRQTAFQAANTTAFGSVLRMLEKVNTAKQGVLAVVTYHRIDHAARTPNLFPGLISATPEQFCEQLDILSQIGQVVSLRQVLDARRGKTELPAKSVLITFDDACRDFADYAWPALQTRGMPATVFVPTAYPGQPERRFWWDRLYVAVCHGKSTHVDTDCGTFVLESDQQRSRAFRTLRDQVKQLQHESAMQLVEDICEQQQAPPPPHNVLSWEQLRNLAGQGVTLAPHTQTHPLLTRITIEQARQEVVGSRDDLNREIGDVLPVFAYPGGACSPPVTDMLRQEGFELAFSVQRGMNDLKVADPLSLNRINIGNRTTTQILHAQLMAGWYKTRA